MARSLSCVPVLLLISLSLCDTSAGQNAYNFTCDLSPRQHDRILQEAINNLQKDQFTVEKGVMKFIFPNGAFAANPSSPYGVYTFDDKIEQPLWRLDEKDAIIFFGCTPPPAKYFSFRSYVFTIFNDRRPDIVFASLGDSTNNLVINTTGFRGDPFGKATVVTTTADMITDQAVHRAFSAAGLQSTAINTDILPSSLVQLGQSAMSDTFTMLHRVAIFQDPEEGQAYINTTWPILRISPPSQQNPLPFSTPPLRERGTGNTEAAYSSSLLAFLNQVDETVQRNLRQQGNIRYTVSRNQMSVVPLEGFECIEEFTNCLGDNRDATYMNTTRRYRLEESDDSFFIVCGLNHVMTGKATYINFAVGNVVSVDDSMYGGSARVFAPNMENVDMFYAYKVARKCNGENFCLEVPVDQISARMPFNLVARAYLEPPTKVGPNGAELLTPYVLYYRDF